MATAQDLIDAEEREQARIDLFVENTEQEALEEIDELLHNEAGRDAEIFALVGADPEVTVDEYEEVPVDERDFNWLAGLSALAVASRLQVFASKRKQIMGLFSARSKNIGGLDLGRSDLVRAAKQGITKGGIRKAKEFLQAAGDTLPITPGAVAAAGRVPSVAQLGKLTDAELLATLEEFGVLAPWNTMQSQAAAYVTRMTELQPGSVQFQAAVNNLISSESRRGLLGMTRRATQQYTTLLDTQGDPSKKLIWVSENDDSTCDPCRGNAGEIHTFEEWQSIGMPGAATCEGGDYCRCDLLRID